MMGLYAATAINEILHVGPEDPALLEVQQVAVHTTCYAVLAWLMARVTDAPALALIALAVTVGVGQETLQSLWRGHIMLLGSAVDLVVDGLGAALGYGLWRWRA